ncbi:dolichyl-P-Man:Man(7)GlcNAc(2)-PP-dolichol alpha-1,6-mannosyltransferase [Desmophyllum pertusum]|uniref:Mannosyltransferase n=1 Tax=Desmophyllum pertusum TaxID=174260 RepID=A0A9X0D180_9CNID|nr:dolichyl-P-Man:Man(7)GlcNAc(2)-PP-dolichol alpha-1,6-mannosyltransferase [Desmophyllum pertusum]
MAVRFCLGLLSLLAFSKFRSSISLRFGQDVGNFLAVITATQFHFLFYISRPLPNIFALILDALLFGLVLVPLGLWRDRRTWTLACPCVGFVFLYSFLPHKELRFIIYVIPVFNAIAACGLSYIYKNEAKWRPCIALVVKLVTVVGLLSNCLVTGLLMFISHNNYPGGVALQTLHKLLHNHTEPCYVHISVAAAQTGISRFGEINPSWRYSKKEDMKDGSPEMLAFSHLLSEPPCERMKHSHVLLDKVTGFDRVTFDLKRFPFVFPLMSAKICILERRGWRKPNTERI